MEKETRKAFVIGHKNPDTDSICSAIAYADIKRRTTDKEFVAKRAGQLNEETQFVLRKFQVPEPGFKSDVGTQVKDMSIRKMEGVGTSISIKKAWKLMKDANCTTLPIVSENTLIGLITIGDIATSYMDVYDSTILSTARTQYKNILETLDGTLVIGNEHSYFTKGKVLIAAANPDMMENYIEADDLVILGNRYESQLCAIEMDASCIIVCEGATISRTIRQMAEQKSCTIISTPHDTYTVARLINQSIPVKQFMAKDNIITFQTDDLVDSIKGIMAKKRHRYFPILDKRGNYVGMISRRDMLDLRKKQIILVDHNERSQAVDGIDSAEILEIIDHHRIGSLETITPVYFRNQPVGCTATILYQIYQEKQLQIEPSIAGLLCAAIISDTLMYRSPTCTDDDKCAAQSLALIAGIDVEEFADEMFKAGSNLKGKSAEEIFYQDYKIFTVDDITFGIGQINSMNHEELLELGEKLLPYMDKRREERKIDMIFFMLTDILDESTELICSGDAAKRAASEAFFMQQLQDIYFLKGIVSRKKQLLPALMMAIQG